MSDPTLLHELDWHKPSPGARRRAYMCGYRFFEVEHGKYNVLPDSMRDGPHWADLNPLTAQAVLIRARGLNPGSYIDRVSGFAGGTLPPSSGQTVAENVQKKGENYGL